MIKMFELKGKRAIVTGGAQGLGKEFSKRLLQAGCLVCISDIDELRGDETKREFQRMFGLDDSKVCFAKCDVTRKEDWDKLWNVSEQILGGQISILVNNAGVNPLFGWETNLDVMLVGATRGVFTAIQRMGRSHGGHGGRIVNTASVAGFVTGGFPLEGAGYTVSKHGIVALTRAFVDSEPSTYDVDAIKCYALAPRFADTNLVRSSFETAEQQGKEWVHRGATLKSMADLTKKTGRVLTVNEVGEALMESLKQDKNGAVYVVMSDMPLIEYPHDAIIRFYSIAMMAKLIGSRLGLDILRPKHIYIIYMCFFFALFHLINFLFRLLF